MKIFFQVSTSFQKFAEKHRKHGNSKRVWGKLFRKGVPKTIELYWLYHPRCHSERPTKHISKLCAADEEGIQSSSQEYAKLWKHQTQVSHCL